jgi:hypothetical protein
MMLSNRNGDCRVTRSLVQAPILSKAVNKGQSSDELPVGVIIKGQNHIQTPILDDHLIG